MWAVAGAAIKGMATKMAQSQAANAAAGAVKGVAKGASQGARTMTSPGELGSTMVSSQGMTDLSSIMNSLMSEAPKTTLSPLSGLINQGDEYPTNWLALLRNRTYGQ